jgi:FkbM family methyltransferase
MLSITGERPLYGKMAVRDCFEDVEHLVKADSPLIVDGGAYKGDTVQAFLDRFPSANIIAFEPNPMLVVKLEKRFVLYPNVQIVSKALGPVSKTARINVGAFDATSSLLQPSSIGRQIHKERIGVVRRVEVEQVRLDEVLTQRPIDVLKLDLQGYELEALKGAERALSRVKVILTEVAFVRMYEGGVLFSELDLMLRSKGFDFLNFYDLYTQSTGQLTAGDAIFFNSRFYERRFEGTVFCSPRAESAGKTK